MQTVHKYPVSMEEDRFSIDMPKGATVLSVQSQRDTLQIWALVDLGQPLTTRRFRLAGTGHSIEDEKLDYIGTAQLFGGELIFHLFEVL